MSSLSRFAPKVARSAMIHHRQMASASTATEPVQKLFVEKIREFKNSNKGLDSAHQKALDEEMVRLKRVYRVEDENKLAQYDFKFSPEVDVNLHDIDSSKELRNKIASGEHHKQLVETKKDESSALLASIPDQTLHDLHLPNMNKPDFRLLLQKEYPTGAPTLGDPIPDYELTTKMTPEIMQRELRVEFGKNMPTIHDDKAPERDTVNFPRIQSPREPPATRFHMIPETWFQFFYPKTGATGPYAFGLGFGSFLLSKEWIVFEHEFLTAISTVIITTYAVTKFGPKLSKWFDNEIKNTEDGWRNWQEGHIKLLTDLKNSYARNTSKGEEIIKDIYEARKTDVAVQLETEYRSRVKTVYEETKRKLNYLVSVADSTRQIQHKNMVNWVISNAVSSIGPKQENEVLDNCILNLKQLASKNPNVI